jgi:hypothetical protein
VEAELPGYGDSYFVEEEVEEDLAAIFGFDIKQDFSEETREDGRERTEKVNVSGLVGVVTQANVDLQYSYLLRANFAHPLRIHVTSLRLAQDFEAHL